MVMEEDIIIEGEPIYYAHTLSTKFKELRFIPLSDLHDGNPLSSMRHFTRTISELSKPNTYGALNGDMLEAVIKGSKGDIFKQQKTPQEQAERVVKKLMPYKKKLLGMTMGNHESRIYRETGIDLCRWMARELGIPYRPEGIILKVSFGSGNESHQDRPYTYWIYMTHGYGGARTKPAKAVKAERAGAWLPTMDVIIMSHDHVVNVAPDVCLEPDPRTRLEKDEDGNETGFIVGRVKAHRKMLVKSSAFLKWGGYAEMLGFPPSDLEAPIILLSGTGKPHVNVLS